jgi:predicted negative regulator of RcsB-dependent stress response
MYVNTTLALLCLLWVPLVQAQEVRPKRSGGKVPIRAPKSDEKKPISDKEASQFAEQLIATIRERKTDQFDGLLDWETLSNKVTDGIDAPAAARNAFRDEIRTGTNAPSGIWNRLATQVAQGGRLDMLHVRHKGQETFVLIRYILPDEGGVNYHEYPLKRAADGTIRATDLDIYAVGESLAQIYRRSYIQTTGALNRGVLARLAGQESDFAKHMDEYLAIVEANQAGDQAKVLKLYNALPVSVKKDRSLLTLRIFAAQKVDENEYMKAMNDFEEWFPNDVALLLITVDRDLLQKKYDHCQRSLDAMEKKVGGDPYVDVLRGGVHLAAEDTTAAKKDYERAFKRDPTLTVAAFARIGLALKEQDNATILKFLQELENKSGMAINDLRTLPAYADFIKSPEFAKWEASHQAQPADSTRTPDDATP